MKTIPPARIAVLYDRQAEGGDAAAADVFDQIAAITPVLEGMGAAVKAMPAGLNLEELHRDLLSFAPDLVFNLVESLAGADRLQTIVPLVCEQWQVPCTGSGSLAMHLANDKVMAKKIAHAHGLNVPEALWLAEDGEPAIFPEETTVPGGRWIIKTRDSHASLHLDDSSVVSDVTADTLAQRLRDMEGRHGQRFLAERFVDGREFNISVVELAAGPVVLPVAEISFASLPPGRPHIVGYDAKWSVESEAYQGTQRVFVDTVQEPDLAASLQADALGAWNLFGLRGYARVDFRLDGHRPVILEANANPCLTPDAGLAAAAERGGIPFPSLIQAIVESATRRDLR